MDFSSGTVFCAIHIKCNGNSALWSYSAGSIGLGKRYSKSPTYNPSNCELPKM